MKKFLIITLSVVFFSCGGNSGNNNSEGADSSNAIEDHPLQDTQVSPNPDGYVTPNAKTDTSQNKKDSLDTIH